MLNIDSRQQFRSIGLIDDFVVNGFPADYLEFAREVQNVLLSKKTKTLITNSPIKIEILLDDIHEQELFTSLQNKENQYYSMQEWNNRNILKLIGNETVLNQLYLFLIDLSDRGEGYSYMSEYSEKFKYSHLSPEWRLHVDAN